MEKKKILVIGSGYVGLISALGLADVGHDVVCADIDLIKVENLRRGAPIIYEIGLEEMLEKNIESGRITFHMLDDVIQGKFDVIFICVGTPQSDDGSSNLSYLEQASLSVGKNLPHDHYTVIVNKSTVPPRTGETVENIVKEHAPQSCFDVVSNPEFLKEGTAIYDFMNPDRIVVGADDPKALEVMRKVYQPFVDQGFTLYESDRISAEIIKYASNVFLANKITFVNELSHLCEKIGGDIDYVATAMGLDPRIGSQFLKAGPGYGGSCFPKDTHALAYFGRTVGLDLSLVESIIGVNDHHIEYLRDEAISFMNSNWQKRAYTGKKIGILGLAFKAGTDDIRDSVGVKFAKYFIAQGYEVTAYDPVANIRAKKIEGLYIVDTAKEAINHQGAVLVLTEWPEFKDIDWQAQKEHMNCPIIIDYRNILIDKNLTGFAYRSIGRQAKSFS